MSQFGGGGLDPLPPVSHSVTPDSTPYKYYVTLKPTNPRAINAANVTGICNISGSVYTEQQNCIYLSTYVAYRLSPL